MNSCLRCKQCRFWDADEGTCGHSQTADPARRFSVDARADDDSGLSVELQTGPEFGCVLAERNWLLPANRHELLARVALEASDQVFAPRNERAPFVAFLTEHDSVLAGNLPRTTAYYYQRERADKLVEQLIAAGVLPR